ERAQLIVHGDPQCLKNPRCWVNCRPFAARPGHTTADQPGQLLRCFQRSPSPALDDLASDPPAITLLAVLPEDVRQVALAQSPQQSARRLPFCRVYPHVQRPGLLKTEPALPGGPRRRRDAEGGE